ncbi:NADP(H)-dependent aldo-keto reductase [Candidatus Woesebacteria bacterium]|nr:NADP(H)-dependent aldo-keto reductase [Candidatus Woesebacteria bacterium]
MKYRKLGNTNIDVSVICLGTMNWGEQNTEAQAHEQMDYAVTQGINFFDTAEMYPIPPHAESQGRTETYIGNWLKKTGKRNDLIIASKVASRSDNYHVRGGEEPRLNKSNIQRAVEGSLKRLQTEYIDLYQLHWPDRKTNYFGKRSYQHEAQDEYYALEETLEALDELVSEGKIRYVGLSNETAWGVMECFRLYWTKGMPRMQSIQNPYSLLMREYETALAEISIREKISLLVYSPLAHGVLTGKYIGGKMPEGSRFHYSGGRNHERYNPAHAQPAIEAYVHLAKKYNLDAAQMALAFVNSRDFVTSNIIGATSMEQLKTDIASIDIELSGEVIQEIEQIHKMYPNPIT